MTPNTTTPENQAKFPFVLFFTVVLVQLGAAVLLFKLIAPATFASQFDKPWHIVLWSFLFALPMSLFEYLYHRYLLHSAVLPFLGSMQEAHVTHHQLTYVKAAVTSKEPERLVPVSSQYPILVEEQEEAMMFPLYSLSIFLAVFVVVLGLPLMFLFPAEPVLLSMFITLAFQYVGYEVWHMILHLPFEKVWMPLLDNRFTSKFTRWVYSFHLMHHWRPTCNLAVVGFWGIAVWDHLFRTHMRPERLPLNGAKVNYWDGKLKKPLFPISLFDKMQGGWQRRARKLEGFCAKVFLRRSSSNAS